MIKSGLSAVIFSIHSGVEIFCGVKIGMFFSRAATAGVLNHLDYLRA